MGSAVCQEALRTGEPLLLLLAPRQALAGEQPPAAPAARSPPALTARTARRPGGGLHQPLGHAPAQQGEVDGAGGAQRRPWRSRRALRAWQQAAATADPQALPPAAGAGAQPPARPPCVPSSALAARRAACAARLLQVTWARGNALEPATYAQHLQGALGAISCIGGFGSQEQMLQVGRGWSRGAGCRGGGQRIAAPI